MQDAKKIEERKEKLEKFKHLLNLIGCGESYNEAQLCMTENNRDEHKCRKEILVKHGKRIDSSKSYFEGNETMFHECEKEKIKRETTGAATKKERITTSN